MSSFTDDFLNCCFKIGVTSPSTFSLASLLIKPFCLSEINPPVTAALIGVITASTIVAPPKISATSAGVISRSSGCDAGWFCIERCTSGKRTIVVLSDQSCLLHKLNAIPKRILAFRKKSPINSLSKSCLSARTEPTPNKVFPSRVSVAHIVAVPFSTWIAGLPLSQATGCQFQFGSISIKIFVISA